MLGQSKWLGTDQTWAIDQNQFSWEKFDDHHGGPWKNVGSISGAGDYSLMSNLRNVNNKYFLYFPFVFFFGQGLWKAQCWALGWYVDEEIRCFF